MFYVSRTHQNLRQTPKLTWKFHFLSIEPISEFLLSQGYDHSTSDKTLFIKKKREDIILVQVYVDDIIFGSTNEEMYEAFVDAMKSEFEMSMLGEMNFFLGLQVKQLKDDLHKSSQVLQGVA